MKYPNLPECGQIIRYYSRIAGYDKYHICVCVGTSDNVYKFLMLNSDAGYESDLVFSNDEFPEIEPNDTGQSVVSLSTLARVRHDRLHLWRPREVSYISRSVANTVLSEVERISTLTRDEKTIVLNGLIEFINGPNV